MTLILSIFKFCMLVVSLVVLVILFYSMVKVEKELRAAQEWLNEFHEAEIKRHNEKLRQKFCEQQRKETTKKLPSKMKILKNAVKCNNCGDVIESTHVHDFKWCSCGCVAVDGGHDYLKRCRKSGRDDYKGYTELSVVEGAENEDDDEY